MRQKGYTRLKVVIDHARTPYYKDLKKSFWKGNKSEWTRTYWNTYNYLVTELMTQNFTATGAHKEANKIINELNNDKIKILNMSKSVKNWWNEHKLSIKKKIKEKINV